MKNQQTKKKRTPTQQSLHDRRVMTGLLVLITILLVLVITLLPDGREAPGPEETAGADEGGGESTQLMDSGDDTAESQPEEGGSDQAEPAEAADPDPDEQSITPWWLPAPQPGTTPGTLFVVLDDAGGSLADLEPFLDVALPLTIAVLPRLAYSGEAALAAVTAGQEVILHQPMEPLSDSDPGPGAITSQTPIEVIPDLVRENLATVPGAIGVNNHMGSRITQDPEPMAALFAALSEDGLLFLDSRTSPDTVGAAVAGEFDLRFAERHIFLDNDRDRDSILRAFATGFERARTGENTIMIGHVTSPALAQVLGEVAAVAPDAGYTFGHLSQAVSRAALAEGATP